MGRFEGSGDVLNGRRRAAYSSCGLIIRVVGPEKKNGPKHQSDSDNRYEKESESV